MTDARLVAVAKEVEALIDAASFSSEFELERSYADWDLELEEADCVRVDVVPVGHESTELTSKRYLEYEIQIDVAIRKRFDVTDQTDEGRIDVEEIDALVRLTEEMSEFFMADRFTNLTDTAWSSTDIKAAPVKQHLRAMRQFTGIVRLGFRTTRLLS